MGRLRSATGGAFRRSFILTSLVCLLSPALLAQIKGVAASVTSPNFGGHGNRTGMPASVTSLGPNGFRNNQTFPNACCVNPLFPSQPFPSQDFGRHRHSPFFRGGFPVYGVPYMPVIIEQPAIGGNVDDTMEREEYLGGPTIFDRRGPGTPRRSEPMVSSERREEAQPAAQEQPAPGMEAEPVADQPATLLVFKDGQELEVQNYAIVGDTLYDMTPGHKRRIALAELDLSATAKQNDDRGIDFRLPPNSREN